MPHVVEQPWRIEDSITELTDTDLEQTRVKQVGIIDDDGSIHRRGQVIIEHSDLTTVSEVVDRMIRVGLAAAIDNYNVSFSRDDYDLAFTIPPLGWVEANCPQVIVNSDDVPDDRPYERQINATTTPKVHEMLRDAIDSDTFAQFDDVVRAGLDYWLEIQ